MSQPVEAKLHCDDLIYRPGASVRDVEQCKAATCDYWDCLPVPDTTCKAFFAHTKDDLVINTNMGWIFYGDEECIEPNPDETPLDPLADQLNEVSAPNECRGE